VDFVHTSQRVVQEARDLPFLAGRVQRFAELHTFDQTAGAVIAAMEVDVHRLHQLASDSSGSEKSIADQAASAGDQALDAAYRYQRSVAFTYRLDSANTAQQDLNAAIDTLNQQVKAWPHR
jgi:hypothetical protein